MAKKAVIAHIAYCMDQNEPSRPEIARLRSDKLEEELKGLFLKTFDGYEDEENDYEFKPWAAEDLVLFKAEHWGDLVVSHNRDDQREFIFVTFEDKAMRKGLKLKKPQGFCA
jgi:hypothetical protein